MGKPANDDVPMFDARRGLRRDAHPSRSFVSATRVYDALQRRFGCMPTGEGGTACTHWRTPDGKPFTVEDPVFDPACAPVHSVTGRRSLFYSYQYANTLLRRVHALCQPEPVPLRLDESDLRAILKPQSTAP
ncbi:MAG TPA: hypothetical protein VGB82_01185 [Alphaproteobacteria bacterium]|jgi:hypothetical protein